MADPARIAIVTGGGTGVGAAAATALAREGWTVVIAGRRAGPLEELSARHPDLALEAAVADVSDESSVRSLFDGVVDRHGRVDLVVNNAGVFGTGGEIDGMSLDDWRTALDINVTGTFLCLREAFRVMKAQDPQGGRIINNGSISAHAPRPHNLAYTTTKHAVTGMTLSASLDGRPYSIACGQIDIGNASDNPSAPSEQADGSRRDEPTMPYSEAGDAIAYMASLPLSSNVLQLTVMANAMPFIGRG